MEQDVPELTNDLKALAAELDALGGNDLRSESVADAPPSLEAEGFTVLAPLGRGGMGARPDGGSSRSDGAGSGAGRTVARLRAHEHRPQPGRQARRGAEAGVRSRALAHEPFSVQRNDTRGRRPA